MDQSGPNGGQWFVLNLESEKSQQLQVRLYNSADVAQTVKLSLADARFDDNGIPEVSNVSTDVGTWGAFEHPETTIQPRETQIQTFSVTAPKGVDPGDHIGAVVAEHAPQGSGNIRSIKRVAVRLYATLPGDARKDFAIDGVTATKDSFFFARELNVTVQLRNTGRVRLEPLVNVDGKNAKGSGLLMSNAVERYVVARPVPIWGGPVRLRIDAETKSLGLSGPVRQVRVTVWVIPWHLFVLILVAAAVVYLMRRYLRSRRSKYSDIQADIKRIERLVSQQMRQTGGTNGTNEHTDAEAAIRTAIKQARRAGDGATAERLEFALRGVGGSGNGAHHPAPAQPGPTPRPPAAPYAQAPQDVVPPDPWTS